MVLRSQPHTREYTRAHTQTHTHTPDKCCSHWITLNLCSRIWGPTGKGSVEYLRSDWIKGRSHNLHFHPLSLGLVWTHAGCHVPGSISHLQPPGEWLARPHVHPVGPGPPHPCSPPARPQGRRICCCHQRRLGEPPLSQCLYPQHVYDSSW